MKSGCVPINRETLSRLNYYQNIPGDLIEIILSNGDFDQAVQRKKGIHFYF